MYDLKEIKYQLKLRVEALCQTFLPGGTVQGTLYKCAGIGGGSGKSFVVHLERGELCGSWYENNPDTGMEKNKGGIFDLFMLANNIPDIPTAKKKAMEWMGLNNGSNLVRRYVPEDVPHEQKKPEFKMTTYRPIAYETRQSDYLCEVRGLSFETLTAYEVGMGDVWFGDANPRMPSIWFPLKEATDDGGFTLKGMKYLAVDRIEVNGSKRKLVRAESGSENHLFGMPSVPKNATQLVICEGEIDAMSVHECGFHAVSVPFGAKADKNETKNEGNKWIENDFEWLQQFDDIRICMDNDDIGRAAAKTIMKRLGTHRCALVEIPKPYKDANEVFNKDEALLKKAIEEAKFDDPEKLLRARDIYDDLYKEFFPNPEENGEMELPWPMPFRIREGEVTVVTGYPKHGKTVCLTHLVTDLCARYNVRCGVASLEMNVRKTLRNVGRQALGMRRPILPNGEPDMPLYNRLIDWLQDHFFIYDAVGISPINEILDVFTYMARRYGVKLFIIDNLLRLNVAEDDYKGQTLLLNRLLSWTAENNVHLFLVAHSKKLNEKQREETYKPGANDVKGSNSIGALPHNVVVVWRNKEKERKLQDLEFKKEMAARQGSHSDIKEEITLRALPDAYFIVRLQREGDGECPAKMLWYDLRGSWQYRDKQDKPIIHYVK